MINCRKEKISCGNEERCQMYQRCLNEQPITEFEQLTIEHGQLKGVVKELIKEIYDMQNVLKDAKVVAEAWQESYGATKTASNLLSKINTILNNK